jgi:ABC-type uncharacterized transport system permease subunit
VLGERTNTQFRTAAKWGRTVALDTAPALPLAVLAGAGRAVPETYSLNMAIAVPPLLTVTLFDLADPDEGAQVTE